MTGSHSRSGAYAPYLLVIVLWMICSVSKGQLSERSTSLNRTFGLAGFGYRIDSAGTGVLCSFRWKDSLIGLTHLVRSAPVMDFAFDNAGRAGLCRLSLQLPDKGSELAQLVARIRMDSMRQSSQQDTTWSYEGLIGAWLFPQSPALAFASIDSIVFPLTALINVVTRPLGVAKNNARVTIYSGSMLVYTVTLTQASPFFNLDTVLILGEVKIAQGMQLTLRIPSRLQAGSILMKATFSSITIPPTDINAMIATWKL